MSSYKSFEELDTWKSCRIIVKWVRIKTERLPKNEFDLKDNISRAARSTTRNIAEGFGRFSFKENVHFCRIARGSLFEIIDDVITLFEEGYINEEEYIDGRNKINDAIKLLNGYIKYLQTKSTQ
jgi:four helix bundle protein